MKKAYLIRMSEDGNDRYVFTNIKALYGRIIELDGYDVKYINCTDIDTMKTIDLNFTYANLVKQLKKGAYVELHKEPNGQGYGSLEIQEIIISSK